MIDVCVVSYKTPEELNRFIFSHQKFAPETNLFVKVNDPSQRDREVIEIWQALFKFSVTFGPNNGYARSVNLLVGQGNSEVVAIFNADVRLTENSVQDCATALMAHDEWGVLGPRQVDGDNRLTAAGVFGTGDRPKHRGWKAVDRDQYTDIRDDAITVSGSAYFIKRKIWNEIANDLVYNEFLYDREFNLDSPEINGAFLPTAHFWEETFSSYMVRHLGYKVVYYGPVVLIHLWSVSGHTELNTPSKVKESQKLFREACDYIGILHD